MGFVKDGERKVGDPAKRQAITNPTNTVYSIKRFMGETYDQARKEAERVPFKVVNDGGYPRVDIDGRKYTPQEISAMVLQKMKKTAEDHTGILQRLAASGYERSRTDSRTRSEAHRQRAYSSSTGLRSRQG